MRIQSRLLLLLLVLGMASLACGSELNSVLDLNAKAGTSAQAERFAFEYQVGPTSAGANLDPLDSYRAELDMDFNGTRNGEESSGTIKSVVEVDRQQKALHRSLNIDATIPDLDQVTGKSEYFEIDDRIYIVKNNELIWFQPDTDAQISPEALGLLDVDQLLVLPLTTSTPPTTDTLNGLEAQHYRFTEKDLTGSSIVFEKAQGELWVALPEKYLVQYEISATVRTLTPIPNAHILDEGQLAVIYKLTDINTELDITPPAATQSGLLTDLPRPSDSEVSAIYPTLLEYTSAISPVSATLFYQDELTTLGWTQEITTVYEEKAHLAFTKDDQTATIIINPIAGEGKVKVMLDIQSK